MRSNPFPSIFRQPSVITMLECTNEQMIPPPEMCPQIIQNLLWRFGRYQKPSRRQAGPPNTLSLQCLIERGVRCSCPFEIVGDNKHLIALNLNCHFWVSGAPAGRFSSSLRRSGEVRLPFGKLLRHAIGKHCRTLYILNARFVCRDDPHL